MHVSNERKGILFFSGEFLYATSCFLIFISFWNNNLATSLGFFIVPQTIFIIYWHIFCGLKIIRSEGASWAEVKGFNRDLFIIVLIMLSPVYVIGIKQSLKFISN